MTRGPFEQGQQVWIVGSRRIKSGRTVENVFRQTVDSEGNALDRVAGIM
jgi:hypothetical protein